MTYQRRRNDDEQMSNRSRPTLLSLANDAAVEGGDDEGDSDYYSILERFSSSDDSFSSPEESGADDAEASGARASLVRFPSSPSSSSSDGERAKEREGNERKKKSDEGTVSISRRPPLPKTKRRRGRPPTAAKKGVGDAGAGANGRGNGKKKPDRPSSTTKTRTVTTMTATTISAAEESGPKMKRKRGRPPKKSTVRAAAVAAATLTTRDDGTGYEYRFQDDGSGRKPVTPTALRFVLATVRKEARGAAREMSARLELGGDAEESRRVAVRSEGHVRAILDRVRRRMATVKVPERYLRVEDACTPALTEMNARRRQEIDSHAAVAEGLEAQLAEQNEALENTRRWKEELLRIVRSGLGVCAEEEGVDGEDGVGGDGENDGTERSVPPPSMINPLLAASWRQWAKQRSCALAGYDPLSSSDGTAVGAADPVLDSTAGGDVLRHFLRGARSPYDKPGS